MVKVSSGGRLFGPSGFEEFSAGMAMGDFNGDGVDDLAVTYVLDGASRDSSAAIVRILLGGSGAFDGDAQVADLGGVTITTSGQIDAGVGIDQPGELSFADVDGDGLDDLLIGSPRAILGPNERGAGYVALGVGAADSLTYGLADLTNEMTGFSVVTNETGLAGFGFQALGDVDGDDELDLLITTPYATALNGTSFAGLGFVYEHETTTNLDVSDALDPASGFSATVLTPQTRVFLGEDVAAVGDVNGDGLDDFILSGRGDNGAATSGFARGAAYLIYGNAGGLAETIDVENLDGTLGTEIVSSISLTLGTRITAAGDVNGDGLDDFIVGDLPPGGTDVFAYIVYGTDGGFGAQFDLTTQASGRVTQIGGATVASLQTGFDMAFAGDVNGDGFDDVIISRADAGPNRAGDAILVFGNADGLGDLVNYDNLPAGAGYRFNGIDFFENAGFSVAGGGDLNGDGVDDLVIGARFAQNPADDNPDTNLTGGAYVIYGGAERLAALDALSGADGVIALADVGAEVDIEITTPNGPPVGVPTDLGTFAEDGDVQSFDLTDYVTDPEGDALTIAVIGDLPAGVTRDGNMLHLDPDALADAAMLGAGQDVTTGILLTATDTAGNTSDRFSLSFTVTGVDDPLIVPDLAFEVLEGDTIEIDAFAEIMDADGAIPLGWGPLGSLTPTTDPFELPGILGVASGGVFGYVAADPSTLPPGTVGIIASDDFGPLAEGETRIVGFSYFGGQPGAFEAGDVTITITGINDAPDVVDVALGTIAEDAGVQSIRLSDFASDSDGDAIQFDLLDALPTGVIWDGEILAFDPDAIADDAGLSTDQTAYIALDATATDAVGNTSDPFEISITISGIDDPAIVPDRSFDVLEGETVLMDLFGAITDIDDDAIGLGWGPLGSTVPTLDPFELSGVLGVSGDDLAYAAIDPSTFGPNPVGVIASDSFGPLAEGDIRTVSFTYFGGQPGAFEAGDVTITITGVNDAPDVADVGLGTIAEDAGLQSVRLSDFATDIDGDVIQIDLLDALPAGVTWDGDILRFDPDAIADAAGLSTNETETISLNAMATDEVGNTSDTFALSFTIAGVDDPVIVPDRSFNVLEGETVLMDLFAGINDVDDPSSGLGWGPLGSDTPSMDPFSLTGVLGVLSGGTFGYAAVDPSTFDPNAVGFIGTGDFDPLAEGETRVVSFTYFGGQPGAFEAGDVTITITGVNDAPDIADIALGSIAEDAGVQSFTLADFASDLDGDLVQINLPDTLPTGVSWDGDVLRIDPDAFADDAGLNTGEEETVTLSVTATDSVGNTSEAVDLSFTITGVDDPLIVPDLTFEVFEGDTVLMDLFAAIADVDDDAMGLGWGPLGSLTPSLDPFALAGVLGLTGGVFGYIAVDPSTFGPNPIGVIASDNFGALAEDETRIVSFTYFGGQPGDFAAGDVTITVTGVNDAPVFTSAAAVSVIEETTTLIDVNAVDDDAAELDGLTYALDASGDGAFFTIDPATGQLAFAAPPDFEAPGDGNANNIYTVDVIATDGVLSTTQTVTVSVEPDLTPVTLTVTPGVTTLTGNGGADILLGAIGANTLNGAGGNDTVGAPAGQNVIMGSAGDDLLQGGINDDVLLGGAGNDVISGDLGSFLFGSDTITGGTGDDMMMGGAGADVFVFAQNDGQDVIGRLAINYADPASTTVTGADFESGVDQLDVSALGFASVADAFARVSDVGGVATFSDQGTEITFAGLTRADLDQNDFIIA